ncbi:hypothetical protein N658DRAFT_495882 [Parathielavia hyrcaniae]|uniref:Uncharacterized protein n=1 Tax=Parathielavia hyrcaniae TaxID=113614 RepID=A0AAN6Q1S1_9PEZI|nr:hypothetical protein N658DRAFT_495882 [Parathielavia hyrcaniae]
MIADHNPSPNGGFFFCKTQSAQDRSDRLLNADAPDPDLETCSHRLEILAVGVEALQKDDFPVPMTLYHWSPPTVRAIARRVTVAPRLFSMAKESVALGTFFVGDDLDLSEIFSRLLAERGPEDLESVRLTPRVLADLIAAGEVSVPVRGAFMRFFSFLVFSNDDPSSSPSPCPSAVSSGGEGEFRSFRVWKWVKRESRYRKKGVWETNLHKVLDHGEWNAGKNLVILSAGVAEEAWQAAVGRYRVISTLDGRLTV